MIAEVVTRWHAFIRGELPGGLDDLLDDDVVFYSPIVFTPQRGKQITALYLQAAAQTFGGQPGARADDERASGRRALGRLSLHQDSAGRRHRHVGVRDHHEG